MNRQKAKLWPLRRTCTANALLKVEYLALSEEWLLREDQPKKYSWIPWASILSIQIKRIWNVLPSAQANLSLGSLAVNWTWNPQKTKVYIYTIKPVSHPTEFAPTEFASLNFLFRVRLHLQWIKNGKCICLCDFVSLNPQCYLFSSVSIRERLILSNWSLVGSMWVRTRRWVRIRLTVKPPATKFTKTKLISVNSV